MSHWHPDNGTDCSWFESPVYGDIFLRTATPEDLDKVQQCFAAGNWSVFAVWARRRWKSSGSRSATGRSRPNTLMILAQVAWYSTKVPSLSPTPRVP